MQIEMYQSSAEYLGRRAFCIPRPLFEKRQQRKGIRGKNSGCGIQEAEKKDRA